MITEPRKCLILSILGGFFLFSFFKKLTGITHALYYAIKTVRSLLFWKGLAKFVWNFEELSQYNQITDFLV